MRISGVALNSGYWDAGYWNLLGRGAGAIFLYATVGLVLILLGFYAMDFGTPGPLRKMVDDGKPNAIIVSAAGMVSISLIVVLAIYSSSGRLVEGLLGSAVFGLVGIFAQIVLMRIAALVIGIDMEKLFESAEYNYESLLVAAAQFSLGLVVAVAIL